MSNIREIPFITLIFFGYLGCSAQTSLANEPICPVESLEIVRNSCRSEASEFLNAFDDNCVYEVESLIDEMAKAEQAGNFHRVLEIAYFLCDEPLCQYVLGVYHINGYGVKQDFSKGARWMKLSADQEFAPAQYNLGMMYLNGDGVECDYIVGLDWLRKAAEQGDVNAQYNLAYFLNEGCIPYIRNNGEKVPRQEPNVKEARKWVRKAADQGNTDAQFLLDYCIPAK